MQSQTLGEQGRRILLSATGTIWVGEGPPSMTRIFYKERRERFRLRGHRTLMSLLRFMHLFYPTRRPTVRVDPTERREKGIRQVQRDRPYQNETV